MNWLGILLAAIAAYVIGALWYGPLFGKYWMKLAGVTKKDMKPVLYMGGFVVAFVMALVVDLLFDVIGVATVLGGMMMTFWFWLGFVATVTFSPVLWQDQPFALWVLNNAHNVIVLLVMGAILAI